MISDVTIAILCLDVVSVILHFIVGWVDQNAVELPAMIKLTSKVQNIMYDGGRCLICFFQLE